MLSKERKFKSFLLIILVATFMLVLNKCSDAIWADLVKMSFGLFVVGNGFEHFTKKDKPTDEPAKV